MARRLFLVVFTDFCCWFPVGVMGLLANAGVAIPGDVNVWTVVFVLPLNSALNPFLYTLNTILPRRQKLREQAEYQSLVRRLEVEVVGWGEDRQRALLEMLDKVMKRHATGNRAHHEQGEYL